MGTADAVAMDHDTDLAVCAATDLTALLQGQLDRARTRLRAVELELEQWTNGILDGSIDWPVALIEQLRASRCEAAALEHVLADLRGEGAQHVACA